MSDHPGGCKLVTRRSSGPRERNGYRGCRPIRQTPGSYRNIGDSPVAVGRNVVSPGPVTGRRGPGVFWSAPFEKGLTAAFKIFSIIFSRTAPVSGVR